eukprot:15439504-Alexandrium_andersonii.AAC.1
MHPSARGVCRFSSSICWTGASCDGHRRQEWAIASRAETIVEVRFHTPIEAINNMPTGCRNFKVGL